MKLIFLGTTGSVPTSDRGLPAIAVKHENELLLFDCGEGTQRQMIRAGLSPLKIDAIFITHLHGDHFLGLAGLVQTMAMMDRTKKLEIYFPNGDHERIERYLSAPYYTLTFEIQLHGLKAGDVVRRRGYSIQAGGTLHEISSLAYALVEDERPGKFYHEKALALGVKPGPDFSRLKAGQNIRLLDGRIVTPDQVLGSARAGRKVVYTGDTRTCDQIIELSRNADVLIHDCTLADELADKALENGHSTPSGVAEVAKKAGVKRLVLTHISPRYKDDAVLLEQAKKIFPNTIIARDLMELEIPLDDS